LSKHPLLQPRYRNRPKQSIGRIGRSIPQSLNPSIPQLGKRKIAAVLAREGLHLAKSTVGDVEAIRTAPAGTGNKHERAAVHAQREPPFVNWAFVILSSFVIRHSSFAPRVAAVIDRYSRRV
jgi:hypothetical protein